MTAAPTAQQRAMAAANQNLAARSIILNGAPGLGNGAVNMLQPLVSQSGINPSTTPVINFVPRNVGLLKKFYIVVSGTVTNANATTASTLTLSPFGPMNLLSNISFTDLSNFVRINTSGWHLSSLNSVRHRRPFGAAQTNTTYPANFANVMGTNLMAATSSVAGNSGTGTFNWTYEVPISYSDTDLRGAIYAAVTSANMQLQITFNPTPLVGSSTDPTLAVYQHSTTSLNGSAISNVTVTVYQNYLDQIPRGQNGMPILPLQDLSIMYLLNQTNFTGMTTNADFPMNYANMRDFLSSMFLYDNNTAGAGPIAGTDIAYWALQAANLTYFYKLDPYTQSLMTRNELGDDMPRGLYYLNHRGRPLNTLNFGNLQAILNASTVNTSASVYAGYEQMGVANTIIGAQSLPGG